MGKIKTLVSVFGVATLAGVGGYFIGSIVEKKKKNIKLIKGTLFVTKQNAVYCAFECSLDEIRSSSDITLSIKNES